MASAASRVHTRVRTTRVLLLLINAVGVAAAFDLTYARTLRPCQCTARSPRIRACSADGISITQAGPPDLETVLDLTMLVFFGDLGSDFGFNDNRRKAFEELRDEQAASLSGILTDETAMSFKASLDETVVGFITCSGDGVLTNLAVDPSARRRRVGQRLGQRNEQQP